MPTSAGALRVRDNIFIGNGGTLDSSILHQVPIAIYLPY
jgi:hypothetical protein